MGPICDSAGVEQGGTISMDEFQLVNNDELILTNLSGLGLQMGPVNVSSIGGADDVALLSDSPFALQSLLNLNVKLCEDVCLSLVPGKTKLLVIKPS